MPRALPPIVRSNSVDNILPNNADAIPRPFHMNDLSLSPLPPISPGSTISLIPPRPPKPTKAKAAINATLSQQRPGPGALPATSTAKFTEKAMSVYYDGTAELYKRHQDAIMRSLSKANSPDLVPPTRPPKKQLSQLVLSPVSAKDSENNCSRIVPGHFNAKNINDLETTLNEQSSNPSSSNNEDEEKKSQASGKTSSTRQAINSSSGEDYIHSNCVEEELLDEVF